MLGHRDQLALHQAAGGFLGVGQRFLDRGAIVGVQRAEDLALVLGLHVLDDRDGVVGIELGGDVGDLVRRERVDQVLADIIVHLGEHVAVEQVAERVRERRRGPRAGSARTDRRCRRDGAARRARARPRRRPPRPRRAPRGRTRASAGRPRRARFRRSIAPAPREARSRSSPTSLAAAPRDGLRRGQSAICQRGRGTAYLRRPTFPGDDSHGRHSEHADPDARQAATSRSSCAPISRPSMSSGSPSSPTRASTTASCSTA